MNKTHKNSTSNAS